MSGSKQIDSHWPRGNLFGAHLPPLTSRYRFIFADSRQPIIIRQTQMPWGVQACIILSKS